MRNVLACVLLVGSLLAETSEPPYLCGIWRSGNDVLAFRTLKRRPWKGLVVLWNAETKDSVIRYCRRNGERIYVCSACPKLWTPFCVFRVAPPDTLMVKFADPALDPEDIELAGDALFPPTFADGDTVAVYFRYRP